MTLVIFLLLFLVIIVSSREKVGRTRAVECSAFISRPYLHFWTSVRLMVGTPLFPGLSTPSSVGTLHLSPLWSDVDMLEELRHFVAPAGSRDQVEETSRLAVRRCYCRTRYTTPLPRRSKTPRRWRAGAINIDDLWNAAAVLDAKAIPKAHGRRLTTADCLDELLESAGLRLCRSAISLARGSHGALLLSSLW